MTAPAPCAAAQHGCGTPYGWRRGGRCPKCRAAHNGETREARRRRQAPDPALLSDLTRSVAAGADLTESARSLGVHPRTARVWAESDPGLAAAVGALPSAPGDLDAACQYLLALTAGEQTTQAHADLIRWRAAPAFVDLENLIGRHTIRPHLPRQRLPITAWGETKSANVWSRDSRSSVDGQTIRKRIKAGMSPEEAITAPRGTPLPQRDAADCGAGRYCGTPTGWTHGGTCDRCRRARSRSSRSRRRPVVKPRENGDALLADYAAGVPIEKIAEEFSMRTAEVRAYARQYGVERGKAPSVMRDAAALRARQKAEVLARLGSHDETLRGAARQVGLPEGWLKSAMLHDEEFAERARVARGVGRRVVQQRFLDAVASGSTIGDAAAAAGVGRDRVRRWRGDSEFERRLEAASAESRRPAHPTERSDP